LFGVEKTVTEGCGDLVPDFVEQGEKADPTRERETELG
jgi:hypothetical protein